MEYNKLKEEIVKFVNNRKIIFIDSPDKLKIAIYKAVLEQQEITGVYGEPNDESLLYYLNDLSIPSTKVKDLLHQLLEAGVYTIYQDKEDELLIYFDNEICDMGNLYINIKRLILLAYWANSTDKDSMGFEDYYENISMQEYLYLDMLTSIETFKVYEDSFKKDID
jgi:hypothetical protein